MQLSEPIYKASWVDFPMPPSINTAYATILRHGRPIKIKSRDMHRFDSDCDSWLLKHAQVVRKTIQDLQSDSLRGKKIQIKFLFLFPPAKLLCKDGRTKRLDVTNRIKAVEDQVSKILGIDDKHFWSGSYAKQITPHEMRAILSIEVLPDQSL
jgi:Holliday junction resolvase RusA-like endonuclease